MSSDWYNGESYKPGEGFTGGVVIAPDSPHLGQPRLTNDLSNENLKPESRVRFLETFGRLDCAAAVPLHGQGKTYGVLEVVNKAIVGDEYAPPSFSEPEVYWLTWLELRHQPE